MWSKAMPAAFRAPSMSPPDLIDRLVADLRAGPRHEVFRRLLIGAGLGGGVSVVLIGLFLGFRPDMARVALIPMFWIKFAYVTAIAALALWSADRLARPGESGWRRGVWIAAPVIMLVTLSAWRLFEAPPPMRMPLVMGQSAAVCPWLIVGSSLAPLAGLIWAMRGLAPVRLRQAGGMIGLAAGGVGASAYALHCPEQAAPFLAVWYTLGIAAAGGLGAILGPVLLRWR